MFVDEIPRLPDFHRLRLVPVSQKVFELIGGCHLLPLNHWQRLKGHALHSLLIAGQILLDDKIAAGKIRLVFAKGW